MPKNKKDIALGFANKGFKVFPLQENERLPAIKGWPEQATTDAETIDNWWSNNPDYNIGIHTEGLVVIDVDVKENKPGLQSLATLQKENPLPETVVFRTPSGGLHYVFKDGIERQNGYEVYKNGVNVLGEGLDIRSDRGFIVAPGSTVSKGSYKVEHLPEGGLTGAAVLPVGIGSLIRKGVLREKKDRGTVDLEKLVTEGVLDTPEYVLKAEKYLEEKAPLAIEGEAGDATTFRVACDVMDYGVSPQKCFELMRDHWNKWSHPKWSEEDLKQKIENAFEYREKPIGSNTGISEFGGAGGGTGDTGGALDAEDLERIAAQSAPQSVLDRAERLKGKRSEWDGLTPRERKRRDKFANRHSFGDKDKDNTRIYKMDFGVIKPNVTVRPLVRGLLEEESLGVIYGQSNAGKSFLSLDMAAAVALGEPFCGRETKRGGVLYIAAEAQRGIANRIEALKVKYFADRGVSIEEAERQGLMDDVPLSVIPCGVSLLRDSSGEGKSDLDRIIEIGEDMIRQHNGLPVKLVVIDTLARTFHGGDENSSEDMGEFVRAMDHIKETLGCTVLVVHHSGKDASKGARGSGALRAAVDTEIEVTTEEGGRVGARRWMKIRKQRELEIIDDQEFVLGIRVVGHEANVSMNEGTEDGGEAVWIDPETGEVLTGPPINSCIVVWGNEGSAEVSEFEDLTQMHEENEKSVKERVARGLKGDAGIAYAAMLYACRGPSHVVGTVSEETYGHYFRALTGMVNKDVIAGEIMDMVDDLELEDVLHDKATHIVEREGAPEAQVRSAAKRGKDNLFRGTGTEKIVLIERNDKGMYRLVD